MTNEHIADTDQDDKRPPKDFAEEARDALSNPRVLALREYIALHPSPGENEYKHVIGLFADMHRAGYGNWRDYEKPSHGLDQSCQTVL